MSNRDILEDKVGNINITHPVTGLDYEDVIELMDSAVLASLEKLKGEIEAFNPHSYLAPGFKSKVLDLIASEIKEAGI